MQIDDRVASRRDARGSSRARRTAASATKKLRLAHEDAADDADGSPRTGAGPSPCAGCRRLLDRQRAASAGPLLRLEPEDLRERVERRPAHLVDRDRAAELPRHRREGRVLEPAGGDPLRERRRIEVDVERVAVRRHPLRDVDPDRRDLPRRRRQPDAREPVDPLRLDAELRQRQDQRLLEVAAVPLDVLAVPLQVEDRVADELPGAVEGRLAAAVRLDDVDLGAGAGCAAPTPRCGGRS